MFLMFVFLFSLLYFLLNNRWYDLITVGSAGRWALGVIIVTHLIAYNETGGVGAVVSMLLASVNALFIGNVFKMYFRFSFSKST